MMCSGVFLVCSLAGGAEDLSTLTISLVLGSQQPPSSLDGQ